MATLGEKLRERRKASGLSLDALAEKVGASKSYIWELENRPELKPSAEKLSAIAEQLEVTVAYFFDTRSSVPKDDHIDDAFFRKYKNLEPEEKMQLRLIIDTFRKKKANR